MSQSITATLDEPRWEQTLKQLPMPVTVAAAVTFLAHVPIVWNHLDLLSRKPHYEFVPLVFVGAAVLAWPALKMILAGYRPTEAEHRTGTIMLMVNWVMLAAAVTVDSPLIGMVSFIELVVTALVLAGGWRVVVAAVPALVFLLVAIPPPFNSDTHIVTSLQTLTSKVGSKVLDRLGVIHCPEGNTVDTGFRQYFVDQACSGINSLFSTIAVTLFCVLYFGLFTRTTWKWGLVRTAILMMAAVFWVVMANVTRVTSIVWLDTRWHIDLGKEHFDWAQDYSWIPGPHGLFGFFLFALVLALMYSTNQFLMFLGTAVRWGEAPPPAPDDVPPPPADAAPRPAVGWATVAPALAGYGVLFLFQFGEFQMGKGQVNESQMVQSFNQWTEDNLPEYIGPWQRMKNEFKFEKRDVQNPFGAHSRAWRYQGPDGLKATISFDYPFPEWHDLRICYRGNGWTVTDSKKFETAEPEKRDRLDCMRFDLVKPNEYRRYVWFGEFDPTGKPVAIREVDMTRPYLDVRYELRFNDVKDRWLSLLRMAPARPRVFDVLQVQVIMDSWGPLEDANHNDLRPRGEDLFVKAAGLIRGAVAHTAAGPAR
jgi:exosortase